MKTYMRFAAFLFRHPVLLVVWNIFMYIAQYYLIAWTIQWLAPSWWTPSFEFWFALVWVALFVISIAQIFFVRAKFGSLFQELFGKGQIEG